MRCFSDCLPAPSPHPGLNSVALRSPLPRLRGRGGKRTDLGPGFSSVSFSPHAHEFLRLKPTSSRSTLLQFAQFFMFRESWMELQPTQPGEWSDLSSQPSSPAPDRLTFPAGRYPAVESDRTDALRERAVLRSLEKVPVCALCYMNRGSTPLRPTSMPDHRTIRWPLRQPFLPIGPGWQWRHVLCIA